jgi:hypothetical protein
MQPFQWGPWLQLVGQHQMLDKPKTRNLKLIMSKTCNDKARIMQTGQQRIRQKTKHRTEKQHKRMTDTKEKSIKDKQKEQNSKLSHNIVEEVEFLLSNDQGLRDKFRAATSRVLTEAPMFKVYRMDESVSCVVNDLRTHAVAFFLGVGCCG